METGTMPTLARTPATETADATDRPSERAATREAHEVARAGTLNAFAQYLFLGAPDPYALDGHAVQTAVLRRRILATLTRYWFGDRLTVAAAWSRAWSGDAIECSLRVERIEEEAPAHSQVTINGPTRSPSEEMRSEWHRLARPLQQRLVESGFTGLLPAVGLGARSALSRFRRVNASGRAHWVWCDLESRLPATFTTNPLALLFVYLPASVRQGRLLFDDVEIDRLRRYVAQRSTELEASLGARPMREMIHDIDRLRFHQMEWKRSSLLGRRVRSRLRRGQITADEALRYEKHPVHFYTREALRIPGLLTRALKRFGSRTRVRLAR
jgi:hypothetical protein